MLKRHTINSTPKTVLREGEIVLPERLKRKEAAEGIFYAGSILACLSLLLAVFNFLGLRNDYAILIVVGFIIAIIGMLVWVFDDLFLLKK
jgi:drug/metabolite transporter (DMT)-like permease